MEIVQNFINGHISESHSQRFASIYNPATGQESRKVYLVPQQKQQKQS